MHPNDDYQCYIEEINAQRVECCQCSAVLDMEEDNLMLAERRMREDGWIIAVSDYYSCKGMLCPECFEDEPEYWRESIPEGGVPVICQQYARYCKCDGLCGGQKCPHSLPHRERPIFVATTADGSGLRNHTVCGTDRGWWCHEIRGTTRCMPVCDES